MTCVLRAQVKFRQMKRVGNVLRVQTVGPARSPEAGDMRTGNWSSSPKRPVSDGTGQENRRRSMEEGGQRGQGTRHGGGGPRAQGTRDGGSKNGRQNPPWRVQGRGYRGPWVGQGRKNTGSSVKG